MPKENHSQQQFDVVIIGAGLAGLSLARHLLLETDKRILLLERAAEIPPAKQKVGESTVQLAGYYFAKVLDMEEHLLREHFMKYNLRFYWKTSGRNNAAFEDYCQTFIRNFSNIASYQLDRNKFEGELLRVNLENSRFQFAPAADEVDAKLSADGKHEVCYRRDGQSMAVMTEWIVDTTGRGKVLARKLDLGQSNEIHHGAAFLWVDGLVDIEKLGDRSPREIRLNKARRSTGHLPLWLATNHFMGEGFWFWVIPLQGKTSLGVVYDNRTFSRQRVASVDALISWVCDEFPLFARDLPQRKILGFNAYRDFSYGCRQTISPAGWAMSGESGRFTDPLYSPGSDFIALHNTMIVDAVRTDDPWDRKHKCRYYELVMQALYDSLVPSFGTSYNALGDQETFVLKYTWELSVYFAFFVFPFINDLWTDMEFVPSYLSHFSRLGKINRNLQQWFHDYYEWKNQAQPHRAEPVFHELTSLAPLRRAESTFYQVGISHDEANRVLDEQVASLTEFAKYIVAWTHSVVLDDESALTNRGFVDSIDLDALQFEPTAMQSHLARHAEAPRSYRWSFDPAALEHFATPARLKQGILDAPVPTAHH